MVSEVTTKASDISEKPSNTRSFETVDVDMFLEQSINQNTKNKTERDVKVFNDFLMSKNQHKNPEFISQDVLNV